MRGATIAGMCVLVAPMLGAGSSRVPSPAPPADIVLEISTANGAPAMVRVALLAADSSGALQVFEREVPFSWRAPQGTLNLIAPSVDRRARLAPAFATQAADSSGQMQSLEAGANGPTVMLGFNLAEMGVFARGLDRQEPQSGAS